MVTVITRPQGHKIIDQAIDATITEQYGGDAMVTFPYHGLGTGDFVYITSDIDEYNGFWYVTVADTNTFKISEGATTDFVEYYQDADIEYYQTQEHDWNSIFLPIVYKCNNDRWPINSVDTARTISSFSDDNGYTDLVLSGDIKSSGGGINALEFVKISGATDDDLNGVWQIVEVISTSNIVINLPYSSSNSFLSATVQYYYNNYQVKVKIFAGLPSSHPWYIQKPYEEVAELSLTPDDDNEVMFSISDYIKMKVAIKNNLTLFSLPLNLDAFTGFYISTAESYDDSDNYSLTTNESYFITDNFEGYAIAGKLPFKNIYSGDYADYIYTSGSPALWLTNRDRLLAVEGYFFDVSFIKNLTGDFFVRITKYVGDYGISEDVQYIDQGIGVYRIPITPDANYDSFCVLVRTNDTEEHTDTVLTPFNLSEGLNYDLGVDPSYLRWTLGPIPEKSGLFEAVNIPIYWPFQVANGVSYTFQYTIEITTINIDTEVRITFFDSSEPYAGSTFAGSEAKTHIGSGTFTDTITIVSTGTTPDIRFNTSTEGSAYSVRLLAFGTTEEVTFPATPGVQITEEICIDILETCESIDQFTQEARRLLEDGSYRLLE